jgi:hypothetical protein
LASLVTPAYAKSLNIPALSGTTEDTRIQSWLEVADAAIARELGFGGGDGATPGAAPTLAATAHTDYLPGPGGKNLQAPRWPIATVTSIEEDVTEVFDGSSYLVASTNYRVLAGRGVIRLLPLGSWGSWSETDELIIKLVASYGWTSVNIPEDLKQANAYLAAAWLQKSPMTGLAATAVGGSTFEPTTEPKFPPIVTTLIAPYMTLASPGFAVGGAPMEEDAV